MYEPLLSATSSLCVLRVQEGDAIDPFLVVSLDPDTPPCSALILWVQRVLGIESPCLSGLSYYRSRSHCPNRIPKMKGALNYCFKHRIAQFISKNSAADFGNDTPSLISRVYLTC